MAARIDIGFDGHDVARLADFWALALGYVRGGAIAQYCTIVDPAGIGPKFVFQGVPEGKSVKNRLHIDIQAADVEAEAARLAAAGATRVRRIDEFGFFWVVMLDPEGNEFCVVPSE
jgi:predicted enzyme related to lactoylglutathione lyase